MIRTALPSTRRSRPAVPAPPTFLAAVLLAAALAPGGPLAAHNPHDVVDVLALSPDFPADGTLFTAQDPAVGHRPEDPLVSNDGGWEWRRGHAGMDNLEEFTTIAVSPLFADDGTVFYGTDGDGLYRSSDRGRSWQRVGEAELPGEIRTATAALDALDRVVLFVASDAGLHRSVDLGASWEQPLGEEIVAVELSTDFAVDGTVLASTRPGSLLVSTDGGTTFEDRGAIPGAGPIGLIRTAPGYAAGGELFASTALGGLLRSTDFGESFEPISGSLDVPAVTALAVSPEWASDRTLWAATADLGVMKSTDGGESWTLHPTGVEPSKQGEVSFHRLEVSSGYATDRTLFLGSFDGLFKSENGGETWRYLDTRPPDLIAGIAVSPAFGEDGAVAAATYGGGAYVSESRGASWRQASVGLISSTLYDAKFQPGADPPVLFSNHREGVVRSESLGDEWETRSLRGLSRGIFPTEIALSEPTADGWPLIYLGTRESGLVASLDGGASWHRLIPQAEGGGGGGPRIPGISSVVVAPGSLGETIFFGTWDGDVLRSTDQGRNWTVVSAGLPDTRDPLYLAISPQYAVDGLLVAGTAAGLWASYDGGGSWSPLDGEPAIAAGPISSVGFSPTFSTDGTMWVTVRGGGSFVSTDAGASWSRIAEGLLEDGHQLVELAPSPAYADDGVIFGASAVDVFRSADRGVTWEPVSFGFVRFEDARQGHPARSITYSADDWRIFTVGEASASTLTAADRPGADVGFAFLGRGVTWLGARLPALGVAEVWLDGELVAEVDQSSPTPAFAEPLFTSQELPRGVHEIRLVVGSGGVALDAFDVRP